MSHDDPRSIQELQREIHEQRKDLAKLSGDVRELVHAWNAAKGIVRVVRIIGSLATGIAAIWAILKFSLSFNWTK